MHARVVSVGLVAVLGGCGSSSGSEGSADSSTSDAHSAADTSSSGSAPATGPGPLRDGWRVEHEGPFDAAAITSLAIGRELGFNDNFFNRGDVIVTYDGAPGTITIAMRRFTFTHDADTGEEAFGHLQLWAYDLDQPTAPAQADPTHACTGAASWPDDCTILVYYEGLSQPQRTGADIHVTLPSDYRGRVTIETSDDIVEDSYPHRGDVCVQGLPGSVDVRLENGRAFVASAPDVSPSPTCPTDLVAACDAFDDPTNNANPDVAEPGSDAWSPKCPCIAMFYDLGQITVRTSEPFAAELTADVPGALWTSFRATNTGQNQLDGQNCPASVVGLGDIEYDQNDPSEPWNLQGSANTPSAAAPLGAGYRVELVASGCTEVPSIESPEAWSEDVVPPTSLRGHTTICAGCLADMDCSQQLGD